MKFSTISTIVSKPHDTISVDFLLRTCPFYHSYDICNVQVASQNGSSTNLLLINTYRLHCWYQHILLSVLQTRHTSSHVNSAYTRLKICPRHFVDSGWYRVRSHLFPTRSASPQYYAFICFSIQLYFAKSGRLDNR